MTERIIDVSEQPASIRCELGSLVLEGRERGRQRVPIRDLAAVILAHPQVKITQAALAALAEERVCVVICNSRRQPAGMILPLASHTTQSERFVQQARLSLPRKKRLWQQIVRAKIEAQSRTLESLDRSDEGLSALAKRVRSGDPENLEAQAARRYWPALFPDGDFRRGRERPGPNASLNYGYAVLSSLVARALVAHGLHPSLGLAHHNRYDAFCLAHDLMEPYRPLVDRVVVRLDIPLDAEPRVTRGAKREILSALCARYSALGEERTLFDWLSRASASIVRVVVGAAPILDLAAL